MRRVVSETVDSSEGAGTALRYAPTMTLHRRDLPPRIAMSGLVDPTSLETADLEDAAGRIDDVAVVAPGFSGSAAPMAVILDRASPWDGATHCTVMSDDGHYRASIPLPDLRSNGWLLYGSADEPLSRDAGGPFRLIVPDGKTLCWNVKGVAELHFTSGPEPDSVPENPPH